MATPNLMHSVLTMNIRVAFASATNANIATQNIIVAATGQSVRIPALYAAFIDAGTNAAANIRVGIWDVTNQTTRYQLFDVPIARGSWGTVADRTSVLHLEEGQALQVYANVNNHIQYTAHYEVWSN